MKFVFFKLFYRLKVEIDTVIGTKSEISFEDLAELKYTGCCIKEALRLWPPVTNLTRMCTKNIKSENISIYAGTRISVLIHSIHDF